MLENLNWSEKQRCRGLRTTLLVDGWKPGSLLSEQIEAFAERERAGPSLASLLPASRHSGTRDRVVEAICQAWLIQARKTAKEISSEIEKKVGVANLLTTRKQRVEGLNATKDALRAYRKEIKQGMHPAAQERLKRANASGNTAIEILAFAEATQHLPAHSRPALAAEHPELAASVWALHRSVAELHAQAPSLPESRRGAPRVPATDLTPVVEREFSHMDPAQRTRIVIALVQKYFPDHFDPAKISARVRAMRRAS